MTKRTSGNARTESRHSSPAPAPAYPRPQLRRADWTCLDRPWEFSIDEAGTSATADDISWDRTIQVPFAPETPASGVGENGLYKACWYRRTFGTPPLPPQGRLLLHFGAVDYAAGVWVNGRLAIRHEGGYTPFTADITDLLDDGPQQTIVVHAADDPADLAKPRGKQDWKRDPHSIWYPRTTGIWQTVWLEAVPPTFLSSLKWLPDAERWEIGLQARIEGPLPPGLQMHVTLRLCETVLADDRYTCTSAEMIRRIAIPDPGIDDCRNEILWSPDSPKLIDAEVELLAPDGQTLDRASSYTALRAVGILGNRFTLNGKPLRLQLVLNQGYWPDTGLTAPNDEAFRTDIELVKRMGFNGVRMHQKIEDPRFLYWADRLGLLVWEEMPSCYTFSNAAVARLTRQWADVIDRDISHPCIIAWVPFNESWGVPELPNNPAHRHAVQALYHLTKTLDPTRPVIGNDGWEAAATDIIAIHDYDADPQRLARRYSASGNALNELLRDERPGFKVLLLDGFAYANQPIMLTEFGGIAFSADRNRTWGYSRAEDADAFERQYFRLMRAVRSLPLLAGFCYTQFTDTYQEANGLLTMDRQPKFPLEEMAIASRGARGPADQAVEARWLSDQQPDTAGPSNDSPPHPRPKRVLKK